MKKRIMSNVGLGTWFQIFGGVLEVGLLKANTLLLAPARWDGYLEFGFYLNLVLSAD